MNFELTGKLIEKYETQEISDRFRKREFVIESERQQGEYNFTDFVKFQLTQDRCDIIDPFQVGDRIKVHFNIRGNKWEKEGRVNYFTNLEGWRIENADEMAEAAQTPPADNVPPPDVKDDFEDDLPF